MRPAAFLSAAGLAALVLARPAVAAPPELAAPPTASDVDASGEFFVWSASLGLGAAIRAASRVESQPSGGAAANTGLGQLQGRVAAYDHYQLRPGLLRFIAVDVSQTLDFGATVLRDMSMTPPHRRVFALGTSGTTAFRLGVAGERRASWYVATILEQRFAAHLGGSLEGAHYYFGADFVGGLRVAAPGRVVLHVGPLVGGLSGVQDLGGPVFHGILALGGDLGLYARPAPRLQFAWTARAHRGLLDGGTGARTHWRTSLDLAHRRAGTGRIRTFNVVLIYEGDRLDRELVRGPALGGPATESRVAHALLVGVGAGFGQRD